MPDRAEAIGYALSLAGANDCVLIAGNSKDNFHDPHVCFSAQGWDITKDEQQVVHTKTRGDIPVSVVQISGQNRSEYAVYFGSPGSGFFRRNAQAFPLISFALRT